MHYTEYDKALNENYVQKIGDMIGLLYASLIQWNAQSRRHERYRVFHLRARWVSIIFQRDKGVIDLYVDENRITEMGPIHKAGHFRQSQC